MGPQNGEPLCPCQMRAILAFQPFDLSSLDMSNVRISTDPPWPSPPDDDVDMRGHSTMTEQSMVERVARALYAHDAARSRIASPAWDECEPVYRQHFQEQARLAIAATRLTDDDVASHPTLGTEGQEWHNFVVDEALKEQGK
jgi:hypothetical protein